MKLLPLAALLVCACPAIVRAQAPQPNIIFVLVDDMGWGDLGVFFQNDRASTQKIATPKLDALAAQGMQLRRHYCPASVCAPSRASLLLGVHQGHSNIRNNQFDKELDNNHTLGTVMRGAGYATACIGKWGLQGPGVPAVQPSRPQLRGFDYFFGYISHVAGHYHYPTEQFGTTLDDQGQPLAILENTTNINSQLDKCYSTDLITARAKKWIIDHRTATPAQPFFLYLTYIAPHSQLDVPTQAYPPGGGTTGGMRWIGTPHEMINTASGTINSWIHPDYAAPGEITDAQRYATMLRRIDDAMGDLLATLSDLTIDTNTLIVFTSDNGPGDGRSFESYGPFEGIKRDLLEGGLRVPALVRWPGTIPAGAISQTPAQFHDWLPTLAQFAGVPKPARADGVSLAPTLTGSGIQLTPQVYTEYYISGGINETTPNWPQFPNHKNETRKQMQALYVNGYKGIRTNIASHATNFRIYDTLNDPAEGTNLTGLPGVPTQQQFKDRVLQLRRVSATNPRNEYDSEKIPAITPPAVVNGLDYKAYEMATPWTPDWSTQTSVATGTVATPDPSDASVRTRDTDIGLHFSGYLKVPTDGTYTFYLTTDTGAFVRIHDAQLLDADFGYAAGTEKSSGTIPLKAGYHPIRIDYRHATAATHSISLQWMGPGIAKQAIPTTAWFRENIAVDDSASTTVGQAVTIPVLANDSDDGSPQPLFIQSVSAPSHGSAVISANSVIYTPADGFAGNDVFTYTVSDGQDTAVGTVSVYVLPSSSVIWLPFDETSGSIASDAFGRPIGTLDGFAGTPWVAGQLGNALAFDGVNDGVVLTGNKGITGNAARTIAFFLKANATQTANIRPTMVGWGNGTAQTIGTRCDVNLNHTSNYVLHVEFNDAGVNFTTPTRGDLRGAGWVHCAVVIPAAASMTQITGYLDGVPATATLDPASAGAVLVNTSAIYDVAIGRTGDGTPSTIHGLMDDVRIYPRALSATEIAALAAQIPKQNLADLWFHRYTGNDQPSTDDWYADGDHDGFNTFLEFALGGNPTTNSQAIAPRMPDTTTFIFNRRLTDPPAAAYIAEVSPTLETGSWMPLGILSAVPHPELPGFEEITVQVPPATRNFVRLRVTTAITSAAVIADFGAEFPVSTLGIGQPFSGTETKAAGWNYMWNPTGVIGTASTDQALVPNKIATFPPDASGGAYPMYTNVNNVAFNAAGQLDFVWGRIALTSFHPGKINGSEDNRAIIAYTIQAGEAGTVSIANSSFAKLSPNGTGVDLDIYVNNTLIGAFSKKAFNSTTAESFDGTLGDLSVGDTVYVTIGNNGDATSDASGIDFQLISVP